MHFYIVMRRETGNYVRNPDLDGNDETQFVSMALRHYTKKRAIASMGPNTCVCGPYPTDDYEGQPA